MSFVKVRPLWEDTEPAHLLIMQDYETEITTKYFEVNRDGHKRCINVLRKEKAWI